MRRAIKEAELSLREGNHGFGAVIIKDAHVVCQEHDTDETEKDPTAHAELKAIRKASSKLGKDLSSCVLVSTHEPCPMCAGAIVWSKIGRVAYGYGILDAISQGRDRIGLTCEEVFDKANMRMEVEKGLLKAECAALYDRNVRSEIKKLRGASDRKLRECDRLTAAKRVQWYKGEAQAESMEGIAPLDRAYRLLLRKLDIVETDAPICTRDGRRIVFHSKNFCPTLEACKILHLDTRKVCRLSNENATDALVKQIDPNLAFSRNYARLRPYSDYCEEMIEYESER